MELLRENADWSSESRRHEMNHFMARLIFCFFAEDNDEALESIYIGRRFKNDTERLETLFDLYTKMTAADKSAPQAKPTTGRRKG